MKLVCFTIGFLIVKVGANLLREGVKGEFKFDASLVGPKAALQSASPGLLFLALGVALIGYAMWVSKVIEIETGSAWASTSLPIPEPSASSAGAKTK